MTDRELVAAAIKAATGGDQTAFGRLLGHADGSSVRQKLSGLVGLTRLERRLFRVLVAHPQVAKWLAQAE